MLAKRMHPKLHNFRIALPAATHRVAASCADVDCTHYLGGWATVAAVGSPQEEYIRNRSQRRWRVEQTSPTILTFIFEAGQRCFREHTRLNGREPFYLHETAEGRRVHRPQDFIEHAHQEIGRHFQSAER